MTLFVQIDPGGLTSLVLMETELLMAAVIWSAGSETKSPHPTPMLVPFALYSHSHSTYLNTCSVMKANTAREEQSNEPSTMKTSIVWQLQGNGSRVTWWHWAKSAWVLFRVTIYSTVTYTNYMYRVTKSWPLAHCIKCSWFICPCTMSMLYVDLCLAVNNVLSI